MIQQTLAWQPDPADSNSCFCMIRLGMMVHRVRAIPLIRKFQKAIDQAAREAMQAQAGLLQSERMIFRWNHFGYLQYWNTLDQMLAWSHEKPHTDWWAAAVNRQRKNQDFSIYHETYVVERGNFEAIYMNPGDHRPGASRFGTLVSPQGSLATARGRLGKSHAGESKS
ncbi:MAG: hypothetical protein RJA81_2037 [Planctomycetota bacterium]|jgi:hypothetical protein